MSTEEQPQVRTMADSNEKGLNLIPILIGGSLVFIVAALIFAYVGWQTLYDNSYKARIVGGDAYNYIIYAGRGTALVCIGIICSVVAATFAIFALIDLIEKQHPLARK